MNMEDLIEKLNKLEYHLRVISQTINHREHPVEALILSMDWDESQLDRAHDIFEKYSNKLTANESIEWRNFERELCHEFGITYQEVKSIVLAFYRNHQWSEVCVGYAMSFEPSTPIEFHSITRNQD